MHKVPVTFYIGNNYVFLICRHACVKLSTCKCEAVTHAMQAASECDVVEDILLVDSKIV